MASPQTENGYTKIADEILEALAQARMSGHEWRLVMGLLRQTYGYEKTNDEISFSQWENLTGLGRRRIGEAIRRLEARKVIVVDRSGHTNGYSFQKDYARWDGTQIRTSTEKRTSAQKRNETSAQKRTHNIHDKHDIHDVGKTELPTLPSELTPGQRYFLSSFGAKRFQTKIQRETVGLLEQQYGLGKLQECVDWAAKVGMSRGRAVVSIEKAIKTWNDSGKVDLR